MLTEQFDVNHSTIARRLKKLSKVWKLAGWVPYEHNKAEPVRIFTEMLQRNEQNPISQFLVTGDDSWLLFKNIKKKVCVDPDQISEGIPKVHCKKAIWCVW
jgi:hypothetical protein